MKTSIEDIILDRDRRGISALAPYLPEGFCGEAADLVLDNPGPVIIVTGFYILSAGAAETDGPPGAIAIGKALRTIGHDVFYVTDKYAEPIITPIVGNESSVVDFPITDDVASKDFAAGLISDIQPSMIISIERCGPTEDGVYRNMRNKDITENTARLDTLFYNHPNTIGIGDGGNEIGMGNLSTVISEVDSLVDKSCITKTAKLVISSVSNWGGYGLVAAMSIRCQRNLLISVREEEQIVRSVVDMGAVDGISNKCEYKVDGFSIEENSEIIVQLHELLDREGLSK